MKEIFIRALSGSVYAFAIIGSLLFNEFIFYVILFLFVGLTVYEFQKLINDKSILPYVFLIFLWGSLVLLDYKFKYYFKFLLFPTILTHIMLLLWLFKKSELIKKEYFKNLLSIFYITLSGFFIILLTTYNEQYNPYILIVLYMLTWVNNTFAYIIGTLFGKKLIFKSISPKKSWEGLLGGIVFCFFAYYLMIHYNFPLQKKLILLITICTPILNFYGDLIQSKFKRLAKVKNSGTIIPGHGGFYDRMDSILFTAPWIYLILLIY